VPCVYPVDGADDPALPRGSRPGAVAPDAPLGNDWLMSNLGGRVVVLALGCEVPTIEGAEVLSPKVTDTIQKRYLGDLKRAVYVIRPDQVVAARWPYVDALSISKAVTAIWRRG